jgi:hypothetical protein
MARRAAEVAEGYQWSRQREIYRGVVDALLDRSARRLTWWRSAPGPVR